MNNLKKQLEERVKDSLAIVERIGINNLSLNPNSNSNFNIDSGIDTIGLFSSILGLVVLLMTPVVGDVNCRSGFSISGGR
ncbi:hypothetical protein DR8_03730 [Helicobacter pylori]|nr:hypothetical protein [Helicobacter pylori]